MRITDLYRDEKHVIETNLYLKHPFVQTLLKAWQDVNRKEKAISGKNYVLTGHFKDMMTYHDGYNEIRFQYDLNITTYTDAYGEEGLRIHFKGDEYIFEYSNQDSAYVYNPSDHPNEYVFYILRDELEPLKEYFDRENKDYVSITA